MATFAHIETGCVLDAQSGDTVEDYLARFTGVDTSEWSVVEVSDDALGQPNGLSIDEKGDVVIPEPAAPPVAAKPTQKAALASMAADLLAAIQALP